MRSPTITVREFNRLGGELRALCGYLGLQDLSHVAEGISFFSFGPPRLPQANSLAATVFVDQGNSGFLKSSPHRVNCVLRHPSTPFFEIHDSRKA